MTRSRNTFDGRNAETRDILLVEDNSGDVRLIQEAMSEAEISHRLHVASDGTDGLDFIHQRGDYADAPRPDLVLLDLNLPQLNGDEVLNTLKTDADYCEIPVIMLTSSDTPETIRQSYRLGANAHLTKPVTPDEFVDLVRSFEQFWLSAVNLPTR